MKRFWTNLRGIVGALVILAVFWWLVSPVIGIGMLVVLLIYFTLDTTSRLFVPRNQQETNIQQGLCPDCGHDLSKIAAGQTTCPNCGEAVPAPLRKWVAR